LYKKIYLEFFLVYLIVIFNNTYYILAMKIKDILFPLAVIPLGIAFALICFLLYISGGKNRHLVAAKIRTGAIILSFSYFVSCGYPQRTCYEMPPSPNAVMMTLGDSIHSGDSIEGNIYNPSFANYSYRIMDSSGNVKLQEALLIPVSGSFAKNQENFILVIDSKLKAGQYQLKIFSENSSVITGTKLLDSIPFRIIPKSIYKQAQEIIKKK
jgi:hypothetical protein